MGKTARVVLCGLKGVGKTAILEQLIYGNITNTTVWMQLLFYIFSNMLEIAVCFSQSLLK
jgi:adenylate kinase